MFAAYLDRLVLGVGRTRNSALANARRHGYDNPDWNLDVGLITPEAADFVRAGGDCRGLEFTFLHGDPESETLIRMQKAI